MICSERVLIAGWFSFPGKKATFGDVQAMEVLTNWLMHARIAFDVAGKDVNGVDLGRRGGVGQSTRSDTTRLPY